MKPLNCLKIHYEQIKFDCRLNPTEFNNGYIQALYDQHYINDKQYNELTDIIDNS